MHRLTIYMSDKEMKALAELSRRMMRNCEAQAKVIIINQLLSLGLLLQPEKEREEGGNNDK